MTVRGRDRALAATLATATALPIAYLGLRAIAAAGERSPPPESVLYTSHAAFLWRLAAALHLAIFVGILAATTRLSEVLVDRPGARDALLVVVALALVATSLRWP